MYNKFSVIVQDFFLSKSIIIIILPKTSFGTKKLVVFLLL